MSVARDEYTSQIRFDSTLIGICSVTVILFTYIIFRVVRTIKCSDPIFLLMLILLQLSLIFNILYFGNNLKIVKGARNGVEFTINHKFYCETSIYPALPAIFLALGTMLNINKWIYYNLRTRTYKNGNPTKDNKLQLINRAKILNLITFLLCIGLLIPYFLSFYLGCNQKKYYDETN